MAELQNVQGPTADRPLRRWIVSSIVVALLVAIIAHIVSSADEVRYLRRLSAVVITSALTFQVLVQLLVSSSLLLPLRAFVKELGFWEFFMVRTGGFLAGYVLPVAGGLAVRLAYLRRRGVTYLDFAWATLLANVVALLAAAALAAVATAVLWAAVGTPPAPVLALSAVVLALAIGTAILFQRLPRMAAHRWLNRWRWIAGFGDMQASHSTVAAVFGVSLVRHCLNFLTFGLLYQALSGKPGDVLTGGLVYALTSPVRMVNITPGNLGVNEWVIAIVGQALAFDVTTGLIVALVFRGISLASQGVGALVGWACLWVGEGAQP